MNSALVIEKSSIPSTFSLFLCLFKRMELNFLELFQISRDLELLLDTGGSLLKISSSLSEIYVVELSILTSISLSKASFARLLFLSLRDKTFSDSTFTSVLKLNSFKPGLVT